MNSVVEGVDYVWPTCLACGRDLWNDELDRLACRPCGDRTATRLAELPALYRRLDTTAALMKGASRTSSGGSGTRTAPIPPRLDVLALVGPGGVAARLSAIEDSWRKVLGWTVAPWRGSPAQAVPQLVKFLADNLLWAASSYEEVGQDVDELRRLHGQCKAAIENKQTHGDVKIGLCPELVEGERCFEQLYASARSFKTACARCGTAWQGEDEWRALRAAQERALAEAAGAAA